MSQVQQIHRLPADRRQLEASNSAVAVAQAGNTTLLDLDVRELDRIFVQFDVTGQALDAFIVQASAHRDATPTSLASAAAHYTGAGSGSLIVGASGDLTTVAAAASGWFIMDVRGLTRVQILASSGNVAGSTVTIYAGGR